MKPRFDFDKLLSVAFAALIAIASVAAPEDGYDSSTLIHWKHGKLSNEFTKRPTGNRGASGHGSLFAGGKPPSSRFRRERGPTISADVPIDALFTERDAASPIDAPTGSQPETSFGTGLAARPPPLPAIA